MTNQIKSVFQTLNEVGYGQDVEQKNNFSYLSWANAWTYLKKFYPNAQRKVYEHEHTGLNYFSDGTTAYVKVGIIIEGLEHIDYLPIMDYRNQSIQLAKITSSDVNKSIQRSTAKAIAMHGLGIQLWTGEDIPEMVMESPIKTEKEAVSANKSTKGSATPKKAVNSSSNQSDSPKKTTLKLDESNKNAIGGYIMANISQNFEFIMSQFNKKYAITPAVEKELNLMYEGFKINNAPSDEQK
jgi:hypothetical protein